MLLLEKHVALYGILVIGMTYVIITGGIDLSIGAVVGLAGIIAGSMIQNCVTLQSMGVMLYFSVPLVVLITIICGATVGLINGAISSFYYRSGGFNMKIAVIGSTNIDVVSYIDKIPAGGETRAAQNFHTAHGGKGANQAVAAAKLGAEVLMVSAVGNDLFGKGALENFKQNKIDTSRISVIEDVATGEATIIVEASGQNRILLYKGANDKLTPELVLQAADDLKACGMIVLQLEIPLETVYAAIDFANANKIPVLLNPAPAVKNLSIDMACKCDFFVPNETELGILTGMPVGSREEIKTAAQSLLAKGLKNVIVTMGSKGALWLSSDREEFVPARKVQAVDSTGAGDSFIGCFVEHYTKTADVLESVKRASLYATLSVTKKGTQDSYATVEEFKDFCG